MIGPRPLLHSLRVLPVPPAADLLPRLRAGDRDARRALFEGWTPIVMRWCASLGGPRVDAEDAAHDVLVTAMRRLGDLRDDTRFDAWMFGITRRVLAAHRRSAWVRRWLPSAVVEVPDPADGPGARTERSELAARVQGVLDQLPTELREVLVLCDLEERPDEAVAVLIQIPAGTVKSRLRRARERFALLAQDADLAPDRPAHAGGDR